MDYHDPKIAALYELANPLGRDADFYLSLAGHKSCNVLDLGCGTGTLCCAFAERGHSVTGVDPAAAMLSVAQGKAHAERVEWVESPAQAYSSARRFDLIVMTGHAFQTLLTDADAIAVLETMRRHLEPDGRAAFDTRNPRINWVSEWTARSRMLPGGEITESLDITDAHDEFISFQSSYRCFDKTLTTNRTLRFLSREHIEALITRSGLALREVFGDWNAAAFDAASSKEMIFVAEIAR